MFDREAAPRLRDRLSRFPRALVAHLPTPLDDCPRLSQTLAGPRILMKRDDMTGLAMGGNKVRQFTFSLGPALDQGCDYLVYGADSQSNEAPPVAAAAARLGMKAVIFIPRDTRSYPVSGNLLLNHLLGAQIRYVFPRTVDDEKRKAIEQLKSEGHRPYDTGAEGGVLRAVAYVEGAVELVEQLAQRTILPVALYTSSNAHTVVGLVVGFRALGVGIRVVGVAFQKADERQTQERLTQVARACAGTLDLDLDFAPEDFEIATDFSFPGFGEPSRTSLETLRLVASTEGALLDPVYTSKAMDGLIHHIREGRFTPEDSVVFLHTGGLPALFAYGDELFG
jgi:1-aminocyclopropane-1-carboxylate deaminase/D-cysteine desulfhydrase-like pyridoxal-dependent ACC family enzyme